MVMMRKDTNIAENSIEKSDTHLKDSTKLVTNGQSCGGKPLNR